MVNSEENMKNLKDTKERVTLGYSITLTGTKRGDWNGWQKRDGILHRVKLTNMDIIPGLHANIFSVTQAPQKGFQLISEGDTLTLKEKPSDICFDKKMANKAGEGFLPTTKFDIIKKTPLFWPPRNGSRKVRRTSSHKGRPSRNKRIRQQIKLRRRRFTSTSSTQSLAIPDRTGCAQPKITYTTALRER